MNSKLLKKPQGQSFNKSLMLALAGGVVAVGAIVVLLATHSARAVCAAPPSNYGSVTQTLNVANTGNYRAWSRIMIPSPANNSYMLEVDGGSCYVVGGSSAVTPNAWTWVNYQNGNTGSPIDLNLASGTHTLKLIGSSAGVKIDRIILATDTSCLPTGTGDNCATASQLPPSVTLAPSPTVITQNQSATLAATATDNAGSNISKVDFYDGPTIIGTDTTSPYSMTYGTNTSTNTGAHAFTAKATDALNLVGSSGVATVTVNADTQAPTVPANLTATVISATQINLDWTASTDSLSAVSYQIFRNGGTNPIATVTATSYSDAGLVANTPYSYTIKAVDASGNLSAASNTASVTTKSNGVRIAAGRTTSYTDSKANVWAADNYFTGGQTYANTVAVSGTTDSALFNNERYGAMDYNIPLANGTYTLNLNFSETIPSLCGTGKRIFSVSANSNAILSNFDIFAKVGCNTADKESSTVTISNGNLNLHFTPSADNPKIDAIEVAPVGSVDVAPPNVSLTAPAAGATVSGSTVGLSANAADNVGVTGVTFSVDGVTVGSPDTTSPYSTSWNSTTVSNGSHTVMATAIDSSGNRSNSQYAVTVSNGDTTKPTTPSALAATAPAYNQVNLTWIACTDNVGVVGYYIVRNGVTIKQLAGGATTYSDATASASTPYNYYVYAYDAAGNLSGNSNTATVTTPAQPDTIVPNAPASLAAAAVSSSQINLSWVAATDNVGVTGYQIFRNGGANAIATVATTSYGDTSLAAATTYSYTVKAIDAAGNISAASTTASATTQAVLAQTGNLTGAITAPPAPVRINSGGAAFTDDTGLQYQADAYFTGGIADNLGAGHDIKGTVNDVLFQNERYGAYSYKVPVPNGSYTARLHFAEIYSGCQKKNCRTFNIILNGATYKTNFDIYAQVGGYAILNQQTATTVSNGMFTLQLTAINNNPTIEALEIIPAASVQPPASGATISYADTAGQHTVTANSIGTYAMVGIPVGSYSFSYVFPSYLTQASNTAITTNTTATKNVTLVHQ